MSSSKRSRRAPLTPHQIRTVVITKRLLPGGYDAPVVDGLLEQLAEEAGHRDSQITRLTAENLRLARENEGFRSGVLSPSGFADDLDDRLIAEEMQAREYAEQIVTTAQNAARQLVDNGKLQARFIIEQAHEVAEKAAQDYRAIAGPTYSADREDLEVVLAIVNWALDMYDGLAQQFGATHTATRQQLRKVSERLAPALAAASGTAAVPTSPATVPAFAGV